MHLSGMGVAKKVKECEEARGSLTLEIVSLCTLSSLTPPNSNASTRILEEGQMGGNKCEKELTAAPLRHSKSGKDWR